MKGKKGEKEKGLLGGLGRGKRDILNRFLRLGLTLFSKTGKILFFSALTHVRSSLTIVGEYFLVCVKKCWVNPHPLISEYVSWILFSLVQRGDFFCFSLESLDLFGSDLI
jgi:hypothetical protein